MGAVTVEVTSDCRCTLCTRTDDGKGQKMMATIQIHRTGEQIVSPDEVTAFLHQQNIVYEHWDPAKMPSEVQGLFVLDDRQKNLILDAFSEEIQDLARRRHYRNWDIVALSDDTPDLDALLTKFAQIHTHTEDEVRAIVGGSGIFVIKGDDPVGYFDILLNVGDVISVPEYTPHYFTLRDDRRIVAVRLFIEPAGWVAHPYAEQLEAAER